MVLNKYLDVDHSVFLGEKSLFNDTLALLCQISLPKQEVGLNPWEKCHRVYMYCI